MSAFLDLTGQQFGYLTAIKATNLRSGSSVMWLCKCNCGKFDCAKEVHISARNLQKATATSCQRQRYDKTKHIIIRTYYSRVRGNALYRNLGFNLTLDEFHQLIKQPCNYCGGKDIKIIHYNGNLYKLVANGIDRWNNDLSYAFSNCVACCEKCNKAKLKMSAQEYIAHSEQVYKYNLNRS